MVAGRNRQDDRAAASRTATLAVILGGAVALLVSALEIEGADPRVLARAAETGTLDLSQLDPDVVVTSGGEVLANGAAVAAGEAVLSLARPGHAPQTVKVVVEPGKSAVVRAEPWDRFCARIDLSLLPAGTKLTRDGRPFEGAVVPWPVGGDVRLRLVRAGFEPAYVTVKLSLGAATSVPDPSWTPVETRLDLSDVSPTITFYVDGQRASDGAPLAPGRHEISWTEAAPPSSFKAKIKGVPNRVPVEVGWQRFVRVPSHAAKASVTSAALDWLARHQSPGGMWSCGAFDERCQDTRCSGSGDPACDVGVTGLALLAFLRAGVTFEDPRFGSTIVRAIGALRAVQDRDGAFGPRVAGKLVPSVTEGHDARGAPKWPPPHHGSADLTATGQIAYNHVMAAYAMVEAWRLTGDPDLREPAQRAVRFLLDQRNPDAAWRYARRSGENDAHITSWSIRVVEAASRAQLEVDDAAISGAVTWLDTRTEPEFGKCGYLERGGRAAREPDVADRFTGNESASNTAGAALGRLLADPRGGPRLALVVRPAELLVRRTPTWDPDEGSIDLCYWNLGTALLVRLGGEHWKKWAPPLQIAVETSQLRDPKRDDRGSWDPIDPWGRSGGRVYSTAMLALLTQGFGR